MARRVPEWSRAFRVRKDDRRSYPPKPKDFQGTEPEWAVYWALSKLGVVFDFQPSFQGGRLHLGGLVADFIVPDYQVIIQVQGIYWHYTLGARRQARDVLQRAQLEAQGYRVVFIDEDDALRNPIYYVREALRGIDHSEAVKR
jgi:G:T-mismatch repair DNA endonuclease (very short patch repair protein)